MTALNEPLHADLCAIAERAAARPLLLSDCEGVLKVWAESALKHVTRDTNDTITGWSEPGSFTAADLVAEVELDMGTWDPGEDMDDDQRRRDIGDLVDARAALPALLAEVERLRAELATQEQQLRTRIAQDVNRADRPVFASTENPELVVKVTRAIDIRLIQMGHQAPYWVPEAGDPR